MIPFLLLLNRIFLSYTRSAVTFQVAVESKAALTYQWKLNGNKLDGANQPKLNIPNAQAVNVGDYTVEVQNMAGSETTLAAYLGLLDLNMFAGLIIQAPIGSKCLIEYTTDLKQQTGWQTLTTINIPSNPYIYIDSESPKWPKRFYRAIPLQ